MKKQTQKKGLSKKAKILMGVLIPVGVIGVASAITLPLVLNKKSNPESGDVVEVKMNDGDGSSYEFYFDEAETESFTLEKGKTYSFTNMKCSAAMKVAMGGSQWPDMAEIELKCAGSDYEIKGEVVSMKVGGVEWNEQQTDSGTRFEAVFTRPASQTSIDVDAPIELKIKISNESTIVGPSSINVTFTKN